MVRIDPEQAVQEQQDKSVEDHHEQQLAILISDLADQVARGESLELEQVCRQHPEFANDLRELWGVVVVANVAGVEHAQATLPLEGRFQPQTFDLPHTFAGYTLEKELGRGGMGIVFQARRNSDNQTVAIKMILRGDFATRAERARFESEALAASRLDHPNIIPIYEIGKQNQQDYFCMKLIRGESLAQRLAKGPMSAHEAAKVMVQIAQAIEHAHQRGVLHRDVKPSNILIDSSGKAYIVDFGLAKSAHGNNSLTKSGAVLGTPSYMAPEQASGSGNQVGPAADIYSLGAVLYHCLTGKPPFLGASPVDTVLMVIEQDPVPPRVINQNCNRQMEMIAMRCLQKPTDLRYASSKALADDLQAFMEDKTVAAAEGRFSQIIGTLMRETHHAVVMENWGVLWMWHSLILMVNSLLTEFLFWMEVTNRWTYWSLWTIFLGTWAIVFWYLRRRMGPVTFIERQVAHVWGASMIAVMLLFPLESMLGLPVLTLSPFLAVLAGMVFLIKGGMLSGFFYLPASVMFAMAILMAVVPSWAMVIFGFSSAACFFLSGMKYYRRKSNRLKKQR